MTTISSIKCGLFAAAAGLLTASASAQLTTTLTATTQGWYDNSGLFSSGSSGFITGSFEGTSYNSFFVFDRSTDPLLTSVDIHKATLEIFLPQNLLDLGLSYFSTDAHDTGALFSLYKYEGDKAALKDGSGDVAAFLDLGEDAAGSFGARAVSSADNVAGALFTVDLTQYFLDYLNGLNGEFVLGGTLSNPNDTPLPEDYEYMFGFSEFSPLASLRLEFVAVPEPSTYGLIGAAALGLLVWRRRAVKAVRKS